MCYVIIFDHLPVHILMNLVNPDGFFSFFFFSGLSPIDKSNLFIVWFLGADLIWGLSGGFFCDADEDFRDCTDWVSESSLGGKNFGVSHRTAWMTSSPSPSSTSSRLLCGTEDVCCWSSTTSGSSAGSSTRSAFFDFKNKYFRVLNPYRWILRTVTECNLWKKIPKTQLVTSQLGQRK